MTATIKSREEWLMEFTRLATPIFESKGYEVPKNIRMSVGFTSKGSRGKSIGECWSNTCSGDDTFEIFITPEMNEAARIADILTHEIIHAVVGLEAGHKKPFRDCAIAMGLAGKMTATVAGDGWWSWAQDILDELGPLPHAKLASGATTREKKQTARMLKCSCPACGMIMRTSASWIEAIGDLRCVDPSCDTTLNIG